MNRSSERACEAGSLWHGHPARVSYEHLVREGRANTALPCMGRMPMPRRRSLSFARSFRPRTTSLGERGRSPYEEMPLRAHYERRANSPASISHASTQAAGFGVG